MTQRTIILALALTASLLLGSGCSRGFDIKTPDGFAELEGGEDYRYRATSADGVVLAVRREANEPRANLEFWTDAIGNELSQRGYGSPKAEKVKSKNGTPGQRLEYRTSRNGRPNVLWVTVFVAGSRVVVVETGGDADHFRKVEKEISAAIAGVEIG
ncbi:MAG: hypothetical protein HS104_26580 [Polyangiaceae bacterium]|nr:hypothetical protein [Polyangiaceae bacterium]MCE7888856.1 hypothetical protein [Sorangiineae bacterium PRO1]MCL4750207.1 hypothetical protein [Myxococcales bacterium]